MNKQAIANIPGICKQYGIDSIVISPGSRNAPLIFSFTRHETIECFSITDERSAAYFALGLAQQSGKAVGIVCTSGTAVLNYAPAIAEAYYQRIPLIVFTADRPPELIDQNDGQTIRQESVFANIIKASYNLPADDTLTDTEIADALCSNAINTALSDMQGPVHVNVPLREPLYLQLPEPKLTIKADTIKKQQLPASQEDEITNTWVQYKKRMILCGFSGQPAYKEQILQLAGDGAATVIAENISNCGNSNCCITTPDSFMASVSENEAEAFAPELLITVGNSVISKQMKLFFKKHKPAVHYNVHESTQAIDTYQTLTKTITCNPADFLEYLHSINRETRTAYSILCNDRNRDLRELHKSIISRTEFSDLKAHAIIQQYLPKHCNLHIANSTSIRYSQLFQSRNDISYFSNRGTSGIDGCTSSAVGFACNSKEQTILLTGDIAFLYDTNALWNKYICPSFKIIVLNNKSGNIFTLIQDSEEYKRTKEFFETPQQVAIDAVANAYGFAYKYCNSEEMLNKLLPEFFALKVSAILEIETDATINTQTYKKYYNTIKSAKYGTSRMEND